LDGNIQTDKSEAGGTAVIPYIEYFLETAKPWTGSFDQIGFLNVQAGIFTPDTFSMDIGVMKVT